MLLFDFFILVPSKEISLEKNSILKNTYLHHSAWKIGKG